MTKLFKSIEQTVVNSDDVLREIFHRLPLISMLRFELVCKQWHNILTDSVFRHALLSNPNPAVLGLVVCYSAERLCYFPTPGANTSTTIPLLKSLDLGVAHNVKSCNGLLLYGYDSKCYVCNLTTNKCVLLPEPDPKYRLWSYVERRYRLLSCYGMWLAFDPTKSPQYKVIAFMDNETDGDYLIMYQIYIYSSETGHWRASRKLIAAEVGDCSDGVYWNGAINWMSPYQRSGLCYYNVENATLNKIMPKKPMTLGRMNGSRRSTCSYFGESRGHLLYVDDCGSMQFHIYELKMDYSEWFIKHTVDLCQIRAQHFDYEIASILSVVCGEEDEAFVVIGMKNIVIPTLERYADRDLSHGRIMRCNLVSNTWEKLQDVKAENPVVAFQYIESLSSV